MNKKTLNIITGASSEIGKYLKKYVDKDYNIVLYNKSIEYYQESILINCDLNDNTKYKEVEKEIIKICDEIKPEKINIIHMAGVLYRQDLEETWDYPEWEKMFKVNCFSFYWIAKVVLNVISNRTYFYSGSFVAVSSNLTNRVNHNNAGYIASKAALEGIVKQLAYDFGNKNIRCNAIAPGYFRSGINNSGNDCNVEKIIINNTPLKRLGTANDMASVIGFFLDEKSSWVNGQVIIVDGGNTIGY